MKTKIFFLQICLSLFTISVNAQFKNLLDDVKKTIAPVVTGATQVITAPFQAISSVGQVLPGSGNVSDIYKPFQNIVGSSGQMINNVTTIQNDLYQQAKQFASQSLGNTGAFIFDVGTFSNQYFSQLANSGVQNITSIIQGQNPLQISAAPLAAAIRAARETHLQNAKPLPNDVKSALSNYFSASTLNRAKYAIGNIQITLPNFIGQGHKLMEGDGYAVVVDDIIVFNVTPPSWVDGAFWWTHEITHIQQYENLGVEGFAFNYLRDFGKSIENEADNKAATVTNNYSNVGKSYVSAGSFDMSGANSSINYRQQPEYYIAQCIFPDDHYGVNYLLTNYGRLIAVNPFTGAWMHIGFATPPLAQGVCWTYQTQNFRYAVSCNGGIFSSVPVTNYSGQIVGYNNVQIGHVVRFQ